MDGPHSLDFEPLKRLMLDLARERSVQAVLDLIVRRLAGLELVALARIWLMKPGDICASCSMRAACPDQTTCLHLVASDGRPLAAGEDWSRLDGDFRRFPLGVRKVGRIGASGEPAYLADISSHPQWLARPDWARRERIEGFGGQPLVYRDAVLGVLAVFTRSGLTSEEMIWLRMLADHAATAIVNAQAFEEIESLRGQLELENEYLREEVRTAHSFGEIVGSSAALAQVLEQIALVAPTDTSVLITGESGTGKELIARAIHERSPRAERPMITVNCASVPRSLFESEFFGHLKGAFTGAVRDRCGRFQLADGGTLFLDEVGEIPLELQSKLLRVLQEGTYERVGEARTRRTNVRVVAATNRDLKREVEARRFRQDLYYRLGVFPVRLPPLRERREDVPALAAHFLEGACRRLGVPPLKLKRRHVLELQRYDWPGNVRELQNLVERAVIRARAGTLRFDLPELAGETAGAGPPATATSKADILTDAELKRLERDNLVAALETTGWKVFGPGGAAELLQVKPTTLASRIKAMGLKRPGT